MLNLTPKSQTFWEVRWLSIKITAAQPFRNYSGGEAHTAGPSGFSLSHAGIFAHFQPTSPASRSSATDEGVSTSPFGAGFPQPLTLNIDGNHLSSSSPLSFQPPQRWLELS